MNYIICTRTNRKFNKNNLYLGRWAIEDKDQFLENKNNLLKYHWSNFPKIEKDEKYLYNLTNNIFPFLYKTLNKIHKKNFSHKFWRFILYPWLYYYLSITYDRWETIIFASKLRKKFLINKSIIYNKKIIDFQDFIKTTQGDAWNQKLFEDIIYFNRYKFKKNDIIYHEKQKIYKYYKLKKIVIFFLFNNLLLKKINFLFTKKKYNFYFVKNIFPIKIKFFSFLKKSYSSIFENLIESYNLFIINLHIPNFSKRGDVIKNLITSKFNGKKKFENFVFKRIANEIPQSFVENFDNYIDNCFSISKSKIFVSSYVNSRDSYYKFQIAKQLETGSKLVIIEHGGSFLLKDIYYKFLKKMNIIYLSWFKDNKHSQIPTNPLIFKIQKSLSHKNKLGIIPSPSFRFGIRPTYPGRYSEINFLRYNKLQIFNDNLNYEIREKILIKSSKFSKDISPDYNYLLQNIFGANKIFNKKIYKFINYSKIIICTYPETTFSEALISGKPTVLFFNHENWFSNKSNDINAKFVVKMKKYNLIIEDPLKLAEHINNIWHNPYDWYNSKEIVNLRDYFMNYSLSISKTDDIFAQKKKWKKIFDNV
jgi:putative transferase (TIGR04331 family)